MEKLFRALVKEKETGKQVVIESYYTYKKDFIRDLRMNGYTVGDKRKVVKIEEE